MAKKKKNKPLFKPEHLLGEPTLHADMNIIVQRMSKDGETVIGTFQTKNGKSLLFGNDKGNQLIVGEVFIRPKLIAATNAFHGLSMDQIALAGFANREEWTKEVLFIRN